MELEQASKISEPERARAAARLRLRVSDLLHAALRESGLKKSELARALDIDRSNVTQVFNGNGNVTMNTLSEYLAALGFEVDLLPVRIGEILESMKKHRAPQVEAITLRDSYRASGRPPRIIYHVPEMHGINHPLPSLNSSKAPRLGVTLKLGGTPHV